MRRPRVALETMGCKLNLADTELLARGFRQAGFQVVPPQGAPDVYVLNTCTVTHVADRKARQMVRAARRKLPQALLVATGCYAQRAPQDWERLPEADLVVGNRGKSALVELVSARLSSGSCSSPLVLDTPLAEALPARGAFLPQQTRAFVKVQEGCNDYCAYCIIPKTRGSSRSFSPDQIVAAVREREEAGYREVVLTGTQLGDYGIPMPGSRRPGPDRQDQAAPEEPLAELLKRVLQGTRIPRVRLSSLQPQDVAPGLLDLWRDPRLCPHFHVPLQSGSDAVLRRMRRRYGAQAYLEAVERIRAQVRDVSITTDVLVGFPGETAADFAATVALCQAAGFADIHVFPYSPRAGTLAARWDAQVPDPVKQERVRWMLDLARRSRAQHQRRFWGRVRPVLWEERKRVPELGPEPLWHGLTDNYLRVYARYPGDIGGTIGRARLRSGGPHGLWGELTHEPL